MEKFTLSSLGVKLMRYCEVCPQRIEDRMKMIYQSIIWRIIFAKPPILMEQQIYLQFQKKLLKQTQCYKTPYLKRIIIINMSTPQQSDICGPTSIDSVNKPTNKDCFQQNIKPIVGVLRCSWRNPKGDICSFTFGTATLLSPRVILTCTHNIFSQYRNRICDEVIFIPEANGRLTQYQHYSNQKHGFKNVKPFDSFQFKPVTEQLALVVLMRPFQAENVSYPLLGSIDCGQAEGTDVMMVGYPSLYYQRSLSLSGCFAYSQQLEGKVHSIEDGFILNHTMQTSVGFSGGAIFAKSTNSDTYFICGIHTHRGIKPEYNSGLYFSWEILKRMEKYFSQINQEHNLSEELNLISDPQNINYCGSYCEDEDMYDGNNSEISIYDELLADYHQTGQQMLCGGVEA